MLRDYQKALVHSILDQWEHYKRVLAQLPTGGGKTHIFSHIAQALAQGGCSVLVLAHREELITQAASKVKTLSGLIPGIVKAGYEPDYDALIQVASVQSLTSTTSATGRVSAPPPSSG